MSMPVRATSAVLILVLLVSLLLAGRAWALEPDQIALVVNKNVPAGIKLAQHYAKVRNIPDGRIIELSLPPTEEISFDRYEHDVVPPIRQFLRDKDLDKKVTCLVTFHGVPFRVSGRNSSEQENQELETLREELGKLPDQIEPTVAALEKFVRTLDETFQPLAGIEIEQLDKRTDHAVQALGRISKSTPDVTIRKQVVAELTTAFRTLAGPAGTMERYAVEASGRDLPDAQEQQWGQVRQKLAQARAQMVQLAERRHDPEARAQLRQVVLDNFGLFQYGRLLAGQSDYLSSDSTQAALDNELALLWWPIYPRAKWQLNPLHYRLQGHPIAQPVLMVMRLDAPQAGQVGMMIAAGLQAEREGLRGRVVLDSRGLGTEDGKGRPNEYGVYDQTIRNLARLLEEKTDLALTVDDATNVLPARSVKDVALYCGWYSVRNYVPSMEFTPGAVGYHIASLEMVSLRDEKEKGWVRGLINDGITATLGPVGEPYLHSFPPADEFFPLLLTGELTLAEVWWKTNPLTSWMMCAIGDPLYNPYKNAPAIKAEDLPAPLAAALAGPATQPSPTTQQIP